jgi:ribosomal protein S27AE
MLCQNCGNEFDRVQNTQVFCSVNCRQKAYYGRHSSEKSKSIMAHVKENWDKYKPQFYARGAVSYAIETGKLTKPTECSMCGSSKNIQAHHHKGYDVQHRLDVVWLCGKCHRKSEGTRKEQRND